MKQKIRIGSIIEYNIANGAYGIVEHIGKTKITIRKAIGDIDCLKKMTKIYYEPIDGDLDIVKY